MTGRTNDSTSPDVSRRAALRSGGLALAVGAVVAACGNGRTGDSDPGRVGVAPEVESLEDFPVDDAVLLRTASSLENTAVAVYETALASATFDDDVTTLFQRLIVSHAATAARMGELTVDAGGAPWTTTNPWMMERAVAPILETIADSDDVVRDLISVAITVENLAAATHQSLVPRLSTSAQRAAVAEAAAQESRHSAALVLETFGIGNRFSPELVGEEATRTADNTLNQYAISSQFGSVAQIDVVIGAADENGTRTTYTLATPAENSFIYNELEQA